MLRADIITSVKAQLDELSVLPSDTPDTELIDSVLDDVTLKFLKVAPIHLLDVDYFAPGTITGVDPYSCQLAIPADFVRLVELRSSEWDRPILELSQPPLYKDIYNVPGKSKPKAVRMNNNTGADYFRIAPITTALDSFVNYIALASPDPTQGISNDNAIPGLVYMAAQEVFSILGDVEGVKLAGEKFINWLQINQT